MNQMHKILCIACCGIFFLAYMQEWGLAAAALPSSTGSVAGSGVYQSTEPVNLENDLREIEKAAAEVNSVQNSMEYIWFKAARNWQNIISQGKAATPILTQELRDKSKDYRIRYIIASDVLSQDPASLKDLRAVLWDETDNLSVRSAAATGLGDIGGSEAATAIKKVAHQHSESKQFKLSIIRGWAATGSRDALPFINTQLSDNDSYVVIVAIRALHQLAKANKDLTIASPLHSYLTKKNFGSRDVVITLLGDLGDKRVRNTLISLLKNPKENDTIRYAAVEALGKIGGTQSEAALMWALEDKAALVRGRAAKGLSGTKPSDAKLRAMTKAMQNSKDSYIRKMISESIEKMRSAQ